MFWRHNVAEGIQFGAFVPTSDVYDILNQGNPQSEDFQLFLVRLRQSINNIALVLNIKDSGYYLPVEFVNGQLYFPNPDTSITAANKKNAVYRQAYRIVVNFGALPNTATKSVAHGIADINAQFTFTRMYAAASNPTGLSYLPIPNADITMSADATNVNITTISNLTAYTRTLVVLEYLKD